MKCGLFIQWVVVTNNVRTGKAVPFFLQLHVCLCVCMLLCAYIFLPEGRAWEWKVTKALEYIHLQIVFSVTRVLFRLSLNFLLLPSHTQTFSRSSLSMTFSLNNTASGDWSFFSLKNSHITICTLWHLPKKKCKLSKESLCTKSMTRSIICTWNSINIYWLHGTWINKWIQIMHRLPKVLSNESSPFIQTFLGGSLLGRSKCPYVLDYILLYL